MTKTVQLTRDNHADLSFLCAVQSKKMFNVCNEALADFLKPYRQQRLRLKIIK